MCTIDLVIESKLIEAPSLVIGDHNYDLVFAY
jgi:hypothetical protein